MTGGLLFSLMLLALQAAVLSNLMQDVTPDWMEGWTGAFRGIVDGISSAFL